MTIPKFPKAVSSEQLFNIDDKNIIYYTCNAKNQAPYLIYGIERSGVINATDIYHEGNTVEFIVMIVKKIK